MTGMRCVRAGALAACLLIVGCDDGSPGDDIPGPGEIGLDPLLAERIQDARKAVAEARRQPAAWNRLCRVYAANKIYGPAVDCYEQLRRLDPDDPRANYHRGRMQYFTGDPTAAIAAMEQVIEQANYPPARHRRGLWLLESGEIESAGAAFAEALIDDPDDPAAIAGMARVRLALGDPEVAARLLEQGIAVHPRQRYFHHLLGIAYRELGRIEEAETALLRGRESLPVWPDPWTQELLQDRTGFRWILSESRRALNEGRADVALPALQELENLQPDDRELLSTLAAAYLRTGDREEADRRFQQLARTHGDHYRVQMELASWRHSSGDPDSARAHAARAVELNPDYAPTWTRQAQILLLQGRGSAATDSARRALELAPEDADVLRVHGDCLSDEGRWDEALASYSEAAKLSPANGPAWIGLARAAWNLGDSETAHAALERADALGSRNARAAATLRQEIDSGESRR